MRVRTVLSCSRETKLRQVEATTLSGEPQEEEQNFWGHLRNRYSISKDGTNRRYLSTLLTTGHGLQFIMIYHSDICYPRGRVEAQCKVLGWHWLLG